MECETFLRRELADTEIIPDQRDVMTAHSHVGRQSRTHVALVLPDVNSAPLIDRIGILHSRIQFIEISGILAVIAPLGSLTMDIDDIVDSPRERDRIGETKIANDGRFTMALESDDIDPFTILRDIPVFAGIEDSFDHIVSGIIKGLLDNMIGPSAIMSLQILDIL